MKLCKAKTFFCVENEVVKNGTTIMIDAGYNYPRLKEKMAWLDLNSSDISHILITHQDTDHVGAVEKDSDLLFSQATLYLSEIENRYLTGEKRRKVIFGLQDVGKEGNNEENIRRKKHDYKQSACTII